MTRAFDGPPDTKTTTPEQQTAQLIPFPTPPSPQTPEGFLDAQQAALASLEPYDVAVERRTAYGKPIRLAHGTLFRETVRYTDGAVRLATIGQPDKPVATQVFSTSDPWLTGPNGFNQVEMAELLRNGFHFVWNHHQGRHAALPINPSRVRTMLHFLSSKSVGKSAAHDMALLDAVTDTAAFRTDEVIRKGYSRSAMAGEAFLALCALRGDARKTVWSDLEAACFTQSVSHRGLLELLAKQAPHEAAVLAEIGRDIAMGSPINEDGDAIDAQNYLRTLDFHPLNAAHELAWIRLFIGGDTGKYARAVPLDARGLRTFYEHDFMSQEAHQTELHQNRPHIGILHERGAHLSGATAAMLRKKSARLRNLGEYALEHEGDFSQITPAAIVPATDAA